MVLHCIIGTSKGAKSLGPVCRSEEQARARLTTLLLQQVMNYCMLLCEQASQLACHIGEYNYHFIKSYQNIIKVEAYVFCLLKICLLLKICINLDKERPSVQLLTNT